MEYIKFESDQFRPNYKFTGCKEDSGVYYYRNVLSKNSEYGKL